MASVEVTALVDAILSAFANGLGLFRRMRAKQRPKKSWKRPEQILMTEEEWQLQDSLQRRPKDIRTAYDRSHAWLGRRFAVGDAAAHTSLNQVLFILNTGLAEILRTALSEETKSLLPSRRSLLELSERAAASAVLALEALKTRLSPQPRLSLPAPVVKAKDWQAKDWQAKDWQAKDWQAKDWQAKDWQADHSSRTADKSKTRPGTKPRSKSFSAMETRRPGPDPLKRGAWIRSKTERSLFSSLDPSSSYIIPRANPGKNKSKSTIKIWPGYVPSSPKLASPKSHSPRSSHHRTKSSPACPSSSQPRPQSQQSPSNDRPETSRPPSYSPRRQPSLLLASPAVFADIPPQAPARPPKIPLQYVSSSHHQQNQHQQHARPSTAVDQSQTQLQSQQQPLAFRPRPPSVATFMTASTKIGEIPERRWESTDRRSGGNSSGREPLPCILAAEPREEEAFGGGNGNGKRRGWRLRFWRSSRDRERAIDVL